MWRGPVFVPLASPAHAIKCHDTESGSVNEQRAAEREESRKSKRERHETKMATVKTAVHKQMHASYGDTCPALTSRFSRCTFSTRRGRPAWTGHRSAAQQLSGHIVDRCRASAYVSGSAGRLLPWPRMALTVS
ncbi:hypothetical protein EYF80_037138 [Liparis tanakae]|uniref:Uncharacterized protein n=1 Tax=Liparis tanakae TaxID=230148 RepID=A0A4Z2GGL6_9TELE|nr:hypothetical protein EYF80_037138 [Liparis tanakae]